MNKVIRLCMATLIGFAISPSSWAKYPDKSISIIVPFTPGGFSDKVARLVAEGIGAKLGVSTIVDNKPGAAGALALSQISRAEPDGYTLYLSNSATDAINPNIYRTQEVDPLKALKPIILVVKTPNLVAVNKDVKAHTLTELVELAHNHPGQLNFGTPGVGTTGHLTGELFNGVANIQLQHVPYKGSAQVFTDLVGGQIQVTFDNITTLAGQVKGGHIRGLAVTGLKRSPLLPDIPTVVESGYPGFETTSWAGISAPAGTPDDVIRTLNKAISAIIETKEFKAKMNGGEVAGGSADSFRQFIVEEREKWGGVVRRINLSMD
ncbi:tripartite tricarboxylate transporter substrate binding protein [Allopusillimonas soli]|uniref:Tripartite tricarboxylate transporter substrate binding protein n=1 Tax=Allopusillimonas soli TaxID=659016 RepID=A0A853FBM2_9BURK|nr:tripartite tricarboxylate transporter substrate binding protein [Allopusillimonas soli]NYT38174.1 tripartite tricarboxylate transporter substrate binding protein [Allopusillimonas soli]TEA74046.1 tripartite tricarboxylate transporter substrate binding protein [Allopusillimonas soli]